MKILLVEDHVLVRDGVILLLRRMDDQLVPLVADHCEQAMQLLDEHPDVDLVLLDLNLPGVSGLDGISAIRSHHSEVPVVVLSGTTDTDTVMQSIQRGAMGFIPKTHSAELMIGALELIVQHKGVYLPPSVLLPKSPVVSPHPAPSAANPEKFTLPRDLGMTPKQAQVLKLLLEGKSNKAIARAMDVEPGTTKTHISAVLRALNVTTRTEAVIRAHELNLVLSENG